MRVLIFSTAYYPHVGGAEVAIKEITDRLDSGYTFDLITAKMQKSLPDYERIGNVDVYRIGSGNVLLDKLLLTRLGAKKALSLHKENPYDVSWAMMASYGGYAACVFKNLVPDVPFVLTLQEGDDIASRKHGLVAYGWRKILKKADRLTVISNYLGEEAIKYGYLGPKSELVPNAVEVKRFEHGSDFEPRRKIVREELNFTDQDVVLITTSRLVEKNAVDDIINSLKSLPESVKLLIAGVGELEKTLRHLVSKEKLDSRVTFLGFIDQKDLPRYLWASDIFIRPSLSEGMGISFLEAMAAKLPVIAPNVGGIKDFLFDGQTGFICEVKSPQSIADQVKRIVSDKELAWVVVENAKKMVDQNYDWQFIAPKMDAVFRKANGK